jgi:hypothetical protein
MEASNVLRTVMLTMCVAFLTDPPYVPEKPMTGIGEVTNETEIMINGAVASLKDVREGERVRGEVRIDKKGETRKQIAVRIQVDRAQPVGTDK